MSSSLSNCTPQGETTCGSLLYELQIIWDEVGESDVDRDRTLLEIEQECLEVYRRKVDQANKNRAQLRQAIADSEAELAAICSALGEPPVHFRQAEATVRSLREELQRIIPQLEDMRKKKMERKNQFINVQQEIQMIREEIYGDSEQLSVDESDMSMRKLEELNKQLHELGEQKNEHLEQVLMHLDTLKDLCIVLNMDFKSTISEVDPSFVGTEGSLNISKDAIQLLATAINKLREIKLQRMQKLQDLATSLLELWNLMDTPAEEQQIFQNVTSNIAASEHEINEPGALSSDIISHVEAEVSRLEELKSSKMKELVLKKRSELEEICRKAHMFFETDITIDDAIAAIESGNVDPASVLEQIELQIASFKEEAFSRKELLEKVEKWLAACEEECWLEEYNRDENRYSAGRGAHLALKRAEKARSLVNKLPGMVETLALKTNAWEVERGKEFLYDGVRLLSMLEDYTLLRQEKDEEKRRLRDQKKLQGQLIAEKEALYGSKPSPSKLPSVKRAPRPSTGGGGNRRCSLGGALLQTPRSGGPLTAKKMTPHSNLGNKGDRIHQNEHFICHDNGCAALPAGKRGIDFSSYPVKKQSLVTVVSTAEAAESPVQRKPFSPISAATLSNMNVIMEDHPALPTKPLAPGVVAFTSPPKAPVVRVEEETLTPRSLPLTAPRTPASTVTVPMQTALTPNLQSVEEVPEEVEYSFEERRAGFVLPKSNMRLVTQF